MAREATPMPQHGAWTRLPSSGWKLRPRGAGPQPAACRAGVGALRRPGHIAAMPRPILALLVGTLGFLAYVGVVVAMADWVLQLHWVVQLAYFTAAGIAWVPPARALMFWAARGG